MKNFFEFFGFLSTAFISAVLIFIFLGKKDVSDFTPKSGFAPEMESVSEVPMSPNAIAERPARYEKSAEKSGRREKSVKSAELPAVERTNDDQKLRALYADEAFVRSTAKQWKGLVRDAADEYNLKPQVLLAHVLVQRYLGEYSREQLYQDAARHAGERVKPTASAMKGYKYGWSMQKLMSEYDLMRYFPEEKTASMASAAPKSPKAKKATASTTTKSSTKPSAPVAKTNAAEEGFKAMVAKEYGFGSWAGLQKLADHSTKSEAQRRVKSLMMAAKIR
jgi:hypothetical protein